MFPCRFCSENPFNGLFGDVGSAASSSSSAAAAVNAERLARRRQRRTKFEARPEREIEALVAQWERYVHPRAREYFHDPERLREVLRLIAKCIDRSTDPVLGGEETCVRWYGDTSRGEKLVQDSSEGGASDVAGGHLNHRQAVFKMAKPGESEETVTYVNRVLAFVFAADESFEQLMRLPKEPFLMSCEDQLCVHISHISLDPHLAP